MKLRCSCGEIRHIIAPNKVERAYCDCCGELVAQKALCSLCNKKYLKLSSSESDHCHRRHQHESTTTVPATTSSTVQIDTEEPVSHRIGNDTSTNQQSQQYKKRL